MNVIVYLIERRYDGTKTAEPVALFSRWEEAKIYIEGMLANGQEAYGMIVAPVRASKT